MISQKSIVAMIRAISGQANVLTIPRIYIDLTKSHRAALFLSQCVYWSDKTKDSDGWFYKTDAEWREELGLPRGGLDTALKACERWVEAAVRRVGPTPKSHYRVKLDLLVSDISDLLESDKSDLPVSGISDSPENSKSTIHRLLTEITSEAAAPAQAETFEAVKKLYSQNIGLPTPIILDSLRDACVIYTPQWVDMAIHEAVLNSARSWRYIATCLDNWKTNGLKHRAERPSDRRSPARRTASAPASTIHDYFNARQLNVLYRANMTAAQAQHITAAKLSYEAALAYVTGVQNGGATD